MLVYGDHDRRIHPAERLEEVAALLDADDRDALTNALILASELVQGLADAQFAATGADDRSPLHDAGMALLLAIARRLAGQPANCLAPLNDFRRRLPSGPVNVRQAEGWAHYALYPEAYLWAGAQLDQSATVIGLRSIGVGLAALAAAACGSARLFTLRPVGEPFDRRLAVTPALENELLAVRDGPFAVVDEGPGLSGSSFAAVADWLAERGVNDDQVVFLPSHAGEPGWAAGPDRLARWRAARRLTIDFDSLFVASEADAPLACWFEDLVGPPIAPLEDLSGGAWRQACGRSQTTPACTAQEKRKFRLRTPRGVFLMKTAGLGPGPRRKLSRARILHKAGFSPEPLALRHGVLIERWIDGEEVDVSAPDLPARVGAYLALRAGAFREAASGASLIELGDMAVYNIGEAFGPGAAATATNALSRERLAALQAEVRPISVDGRMHAWEWLVSEGRLLKTDAIDHGVAHDLVGAQDVAWDVAAAAVEFQLSDAAQRKLLAAMPPHLRPSSALINALTLCYLGFQIGLWTFAARADADGGRPAAQVERYGQHFVHLAAA